MVGLVWTLPAHLWFVGLTITLVVTDFDHFRLPNRILLPGTAVGIGLLAAGAALDGRIGDLPEALAAGATYFLVMLIIALVARGGFGFGDVKLSFVLGVVRRVWRLGAGCAGGVRRILHRRGEFGDSHNDRDSRSQGLHPVRPSDDARGLDCNRVGHQHRGLVSDLSTRPGRMETLYRLADAPS